MDLSDAVETYVSGREARGELTAGTARELRSRLRSLAAVAGPGAQLEDLDRATVAAWQATIGAHRPATRRAYLSTVRTFCRWAVAEDLIALDPTVAAARIREPRRATRALPASTVARLRLVLPDLRAEVIVALMFHMGLRCVEVAGLRTDDYDREAAVVVVRGKNDDERRLPVPGPVTDLLAEWAAAGGSGQPSIVGLSANRISKLVSGWFNAAGIKAGAYDGNSAHALRHTMASNMLERCGNVRTVQDALGHISLATTERYLRHANLDEMRAAMDPSSCSERRDSAVPEKPIVVEATRTRKRPPNWRPISESLIASSERPVMKTDQVAQIAQCKKMGMSRDEYVAMVVEGRTDPLNWLSYQEREEALAASRAYLEELWDEVTTS